MAIQVLKGDDRRGAQLATPGAVANPMLQPGAPVMSLPRMDAGAMQAPQRDQGLEKAMAIMTLLGAVGTAATGGRGNLGAISQGVAQGGALGMQQQSATHSANQTAFDQYMRDAQKFNLETDRQEAKSQYEYDKGERTRLIKKAEDEQGRIRDYGDDERERILDREDDEHAAQEKRDFETFKNELPPTKYQADREFRLGTETTRESGTVKLSPKHKAIVSSYKAFFDKGRKLASTPYDYKIGADQSEDDGMFGEDDAKVDRDKIVAEYQVAVKEITRDAIAYGIPPDIYMKVLKAHHEGIYDDKDLLDILNEYSTLEN